MGLMGLNQGIDRGLWLLEAGGRGETGLFLAILASRFCLHSWPVTPWYIYKASCVVSSHFSPLWPLSPSSHLPLWHWPSCLSLIRTFFLFHWAYQKNWQWASHLKILLNHNQTSKSLLPCEVTYSQVPEIWK